MAAERGEGCGLVVGAAGDRDRCEGAASGGMSGWMGLVARQRTSVASAAKPVVEHEVRGQRLGARARARRDRCANGALRVGEALDLGAVCGPLQEARGFDARCQRRAAARRGGARRPAVHRPSDGAGRGARSRSQRLIEEDARDVEQRNRLPVDRRREWHRSSRSRRRLACEAPADLRRHHRPLRRARPTATSQGCARAGCRAAARRAAAVGRRIAPARRPWPPSAPRGSSGCSSRNAWRLSRLISTSRVSSSRSSPGSRGASSCCTSNALSRMSSSRSARRERLVEPLLHVDVAGRAGADAAAGAPTWACALLRRPRGCWCPPGPRSRSRRVEPGPSAPLGDPLRPFFEWPCGVLVDRRRRRDARREPVLDRAVHPPRGERLASRRRAPRPRARIAR